MFFSMPYRAITNIDPIVRGELPQKEGRTLGRAPVFRWGNPKIRQADEGYLCTGSSPLVSFWMDPGRSTCPLHHLKPLIIQGAFLPGEIVEED